MRLISQVLGLHLDLFLIMTDNLGVFESNELAYTLFPEEDGQD